MKRLTARIAGSLVALLASVLLVAGGGTAVLPAASASTTRAHPVAAADSISVVTAYFSGGGTGIQLCDDPGVFYYTGAVVEVYNPCSYRVWVHYTAGTTVYPFCVNPGGSLAYDL